MKPLKVVLTLGFLVTASATFQAQTGNKSGGSISGRVTQHGNGLPNILIKASRELAVRPESPGIDARTDSQGHYRIVPVEAGQYFVTFFESGLVPRRSDSASGSPRQISISAGEAIAHVDFDLILGGTITGFVTDSTGKPMPQQPVMLTFVHAQPNPTLFASNPMLTPFISGYFRTDGSGFYRIVGIPPGTYLVSVGSRFAVFSAFRGRAAHRQTFFPSTTDRASARRMEIEEATNLQNINFKLGPPVATFSASGRVVDTLTGAPLPGVTFDLQIEESGERGVIPKVGTSDQNGEFKLENLPAARYSIKVSQDRGRGADFFGNSSWFDIRDSNLSGIELRAEKTLAVFGTVIIANTNDPTVMAKASQLDLLLEVSPNDRGPLTADLVRPNSDLTFSVHGLKPGRVRVHLNSDKQIAELGLRFLRMELGTNPIREIEIAHGKPVAQVRVILVYGSGSLRGSVKLENGTLPANSRLAANLKNDDGFYAGTWVDTNGNFLLNAIPAGTYTLTVTAEEPGKRTLGPKAQQTISISEDKTTSASITLDLSGLKAP